MVLVLGATGLLGQALMAEARVRGLKATGAARSGAEIALDVTDDAGLKNALERIKPTVVINSVVLADFARCEADPGLAMRVNARPAALLAEYCRETDCRLAHVSTDHFFTGDGLALHDERAPVRFVNEYARSKYPGEAFALTYSKTLVVRTNIAGFRGWQKLTFVEWLMDMIERDEAITLFEDFYCSTMDASTCAKAIFDLLDIGYLGRINVASRTVCSKKTFAEALARAMGRKFTRAQTGSVRQLQPTRAESLGLDVSRAESVLGHRLPDLEEVVSTLARSRKDAL
jgi:dTDP-4-dehydrorhamnose reductase